MSRTQKTRALTPSTAEAIEMASASILSTTTTRGYPLGSAIGTGSVMARSSDIVAMSVAPLVLSVNDVLHSSEGLELLSIEWDLERAPGSEFLPEQLVVVGNTDVGVSSYACILAWERGVVDPFRFEEYIRRVSKKMSDVEAAVISSRLEYETAGLEVLRRFNDRLNSVLFVDLLGRQFKASHDSFQLRPENTDRQFTVTVSCRDDFRSLPPGVKILRRKSLKFYSPSVDPETAINYFQSRILTPTGIDNLCVRIPELGRAILNEINAYAYSPEEADIVAAATDLLIGFLGKDSFTLSEINNLNQQLAEFMSHLSTTVESLSAAIQEHISSGKVLTLAEHRLSLLEHPTIYTMRDLDRQIAERLVDVLLKSLEREFPFEGPVRAWQMKSTMNYFVAFCQRVKDYFSTELTQYILVTAARTALFNMLQSLYQSILQSNPSPIDQLLVQKFYDELCSQLNAIFDKESFQRQITTNYSQLIDSVLRELSGGFKQVESWDLIAFTDVVQSTIAELRSRYSPAASTESSSPPSQGQRLESLLLSLERLVAEIVPEIADTLLSKQFIHTLIDACKTRGVNVADAVVQIVDSDPERSDEWKSEVRHWMSDLRQRIQSGEPLGDQLTRLLEHVHEQAGSRVSSISVLDRIQRELKALQAAYDRELAEWAEECSRIEEENRVITAHNQQRNELLNREQIKYEQETRAYQQALSEYNQRIAESGPQPYIQPPMAPEPLEPRIRRIEAQYPLMSLKPLPPRPQPSEALKSYSELNSLLSERLKELNQKQNDLAKVFIQQLERLRTEGTVRAANASIDIRAGFIEYVMSSVVRGLGRVLPRIKRVYLRDNTQSEHLYLVTYEHHGDEIVITAGDNIMR